MKTVERFSAGSLEDFREYQEKLEAALAQEMSARVNPIDFKGVSGFTDAEIMGDIRKIQEAETQFEQKNAGASEEETEIRNQARLLESLLYASMRNSNLFGEKANVILASTFDDYFRGVDAFAEFTNEDPNDPRHIGFSVDFTMSADTFATKMGKLLESLKDGFVPGVKYFNSPTLGKRKNVGMPKVIIGADYSAVKRVADEQVEHYAKTGAITDVLTDDPLQYVILDEIRAQLRALRNVCYEMFNNKNAGSVYHRAYVTFMNALKARGLDEQTLKLKSRGDSMHSRLVSLVGKFDRDSQKS